MFMKECMRNNYETKQNIPPGKNEAERDGGDPETIGIANLLNKNLLSFIYLPDVFQFLASLFDSIDHSNWRSL